MMQFNAQLQVMAVQLKDGQYHPIRSGLQWQLIHENLKNAEKTPNISTDADAFFEVMPGCYRLIVQYHHQKKIIEKIQLVSQKKSSQMIIFGETSELESSESYYNAEESVNVETEYERRQIERSGQRQYGLSASGLTQPHQHTAGAGQSMLLAAHPVLAQSAQFDGVAAKLNPLPNENPKAEEAAAEKAPHLQPSPSPRLGAAPSPFAAPRPGGG